MKDHHVIKTLNEVYQGPYIGIRPIRIQKLSDLEIKNEIQRNHKEHEVHAAKVAERIQNLGGILVYDKGISEPYMDQFKIPGTAEGMV